jgi:hypothetical protein
MSRATVDEILDRIKQLPEEDRLLLDELLAQQEDQEWREEAAKARKMAQNQGINQGAVDSAAQIEVAERVMREDRDVLRKLAE